MATFHSFEQQYNDAKQNVSNTLSQGSRQLLREMRPEGDLSPAQLAALNTLRNNLSVFNQSQINNPMRALLDRQQTTVSSDDFKVKKATSGTAGGRGFLAHATLDSAHKGFSRDISRELNRNHNARLDGAIDTFVNANVDSYMQLKAIADRRQAQDELSNYAAQYVAIMEQQMLQLQQQIYRQQAAKVEELRNLERIEAHQASTIGRFIDDKGNAIDLSDRMKRPDVDTSYQTSKLAPAMKLILSRDLNGQPDGGLMVQHRTIYPHQGYSAIDLLMSAEPGINELTIALGQSSQRIMTEQEVYKLTPAQRGSYLHRVAINASIYAKYGAKGPLPKEFLHLVGPGNLLEDTYERDSHFEVDAYGIPKASADTSADKFFAKDDDGNFLRDENGNRIMRQGAVIEDKKLFNTIQEGKLSEHPYIDANGVPMTDADGNPHRREIKVTVSDFTPTVEEKNAIDSFGELIETYREMVKAKKRYELQHGIAQGNTQTTEEKVFEGLQERDDNVDDRGPEPGIRIRG